MTEGGPRVSVSRTPSALRFSNIVSGRSTVSRQGRSTMSRSPGARNSRGPRDHSANPANRVSVQYHIYHDSKNIDYFANKRGIIRCQAWRLQVSFQRNEPSTDFIFSTRHRNQRCPNSIQKQDKSSRIKEKFNILTAVEKSKSTALDVTCSLIVCGIIKIIYLSKR